MTDNNEDITKKRVVREDNGDTYIRYFDKEFKTWVNIRSNPNNCNGTEYITNTLKQLFLSRYNI